VVLGRGSVSKHHARIALTGDQLAITDLGSTNGTFVNGKKIVGPQTVGASDRILIGDFSIAARSEAQEPERVHQGSGPSPSAALPDPIRPERFRKEVHDRLIEALDLRRLDLDRLGDEELRQRAGATVRQLLDRMRQGGTLPAQLDPEQLLRDVLNEALGLGPLEALLADDQVTEILVNRADQI
jgi:pilus assembly protein CpaF